MQMRTEREDGGLATRFAATRARTAALTVPLTEADVTPQSMPDASPAKWHLAHVSWFLETFVLAAVPGYRVFDPGFGYLFNSYYNTVGARHARAKRGLITRPSLARVLEYRTHVDGAIAAAWDALSADALTLVRLGVAHEEQHQELLLTDILHLMAENPLKPAVYAEVPAVTGACAPMGWVAFPGGVQRIGDDGGSGFAFDNEGPRHKVLLRPFEIADRLVTNGEWAAFVADDGYRRPELWLSDGYAWASEHADAPLYWSRDEAGGCWRRFTLSGEVALDPAAPVTHISHYEADAYAAWARARLPTEAEWEVAAGDQDPMEGNLLDGPGWIAPRAAGGGPGLKQMFGDCWEWTQSAYLPYPGFRAADGAVGEYNGKFMSGQMVLKGGSCATPRGHVRASYRNFFPPHARWQFTGLRLAKDV